MKKISFCGTYDDLIGDCGVDEIWQSASCGVVSSVGTGSFLLLDYVSHVERGVGRHEEKGNSAAHQHKSSEEEECIQLLLLIVFILAFA